MRPHTSSTSSKGAWRYPVAALAGALIVVIPGGTGRLLGPFAGVSLLYGVLRERAANERGAVVRAAALGLVFGATMHVLALSALGPLIARYGGFGAPLAWSLAGTVWLLQGIPFALATATTELLARRGVPRFVALAPTLLVASAIVPQLFPFQLGALVSPWLPYVQIAELGGAGLVTLFVALSSAAFVESVRSRSRASALLLVFSIAVPLGYGALRLPGARREREHGRLVRVGVVQPNFDVAYRSDPAHDREALSRLRTMTTELEQKGVDVTAWAESAYPHRLAATRPRQPADHRRVVGDALKGPVLFGALSYELRGAGVRERNSAFLVSTDGTLEARIDKARLLPLAEYVPLFRRVSFLRRHYRSAGLASGQGGTMTVAGTRLGVLICYEDLFADLARLSVERGAGAFVNLTNDAWFEQSAEPELHDRIARMRAVEMRRDLVRVTNTGVSSFTASTGERVSELPTSTRGSLVAEVRAQSGRTPYARYGDVLTPLACLALGLLGLRGRAPSRARRPSSAARDL